MRRVLAILSFSFLIIAGVLAFEGWRAMVRPEPPEPWHVALYFIGAAVCVVLWGLGVRERYRHLRNMRREPDVSEDEPADKRDQHADRND
jgi:hypothetical protein